MKTLPRLKILPCPINAGKHPYHDHRWIATQYAQVDFSDYVPNDWTIRNGSLVCEMRDINPAFARLFASAPDMLETLKGCAAMLRESAKMHRLAGNGSGHGKVCDSHAEAAELLIESLEA